jgi:hypothetical protein
VVPVAVLPALPLPDVPDAVAPEPAAPPVDIRALVNTKAPAPLPDRACVPALPEVAPTEAPPPLA